MTDTVWFITGAGKGLGYLLARDALAAGDKVVATGRTVDGLAERLSASKDRLLVLPLDVTDARAASDVHDAAIAAFGQIDILVNNAGCAQLGWFEAIKDEDVRRQFEINLFGAMNVARAVLPTLRRQRSSLVVTISSVNGLVSKPADRFRIVATSYRQQRSGLFTTISASRSWMQLQSAVTPLPLTGATLRVSFAWPSRCVPSG